MMAASIIIDEATNFIDHNENSNSVDHMPPMCIASASITHTYMEMRAAAVMCSLTNFIYVY
jgi:hypothetical protein